MQISFLGHGVFGAAIGSLLEANGHQPEYVDVGDAFSGPVDILFLAVPVQYMRAALTEHHAMLQNTQVVVNCSKGIEKSTGALPHQIVTEVLGECEYVAVMGPSFASEIEAKVPTTVSIAGESDQAVDTVTKLLTRPYFILEKLGTVLELELASAMKNIYAVASGYVAGSGGGQNTHAHVQVMALREYTKLIKALEGEAQVVRPGVIGDLILTCGSNESRNYQYGYALASGQSMTELTAEGVASAEAIAIIAANLKVELPVAAATLSLIEQRPEAQQNLYDALGFGNLE